jgi:hypothetical protein
MVQLPPQARIVVRAVFNVGMVVAVLLAAAANVQA